VLHIQMAGVGTSTPRVDGTQAAESEATLTIVADQGPQEYMMSAHLKGRVSSDLSEGTKKVRGER
jgi:hypothetical protein